MTLLRNVIFRSLDTNSLNRPSTIWLTVLLKECLSYLINLEFSKIEPWYKIKGRKISKLMVNFASRAFPRLYKVLFVKNFCWHALMKVLLCRTGMRNFVMEQLLAGFKRSRSLRPWRYIDFIVHYEIMKGVMKIVNWAFGFVIVNIFCFEFIFFEVQSGLTDNFLTFGILFGWMTRWLILIHKILKGVWLIDKIWYFFIFTLFLNCFFDLLAFWTLHFTKIFFRREELDFL